MLVQNRGHRTAAPTRLPDPVPHSPEMAAGLHYFFLLKDSPCVTNSSSPRWHSLPPLLGAIMGTITRKLFEVPSNIFKMCNIIHTVN